MRNNSILNAYYLKECSGRRVIVIINYGNEFVSKRVIVALSKDCRYSFIPTSIFREVEIEKIEFLLHIHNDASRVGDIVLIYLKSQKKQAVIEAINLIKVSPFVVYAEPDYFMEMDSIPNDQYYKNLWGLEKISAPKAWNKFVGSSDVIVGVIDSGIYYNHSDLKDNMWSVPYAHGICGWDFYYDNYDPTDENGHGTHVAGTIGSVGNNYIGITGVNWNVKIVSLKIGGKSDRICASAAIKAIVYATEKDIPILNNSWGGRNYCESLKSAIEQYNGLFIAASGNNGVDNDIYPHYPASYDCDNIISVAASDQNDVLASFSNYGVITVDITAPGTNIYSPLLSDGYGYKSGTSMAAPHVAGAAALLKGYKPDLTALEIKYIILSSADKAPPLYGKVLTGGRLNINAMLEMSETFR